MARRNSGKPEHSYFAETDRVIMQGCQFSKNIPVAPENIIFRADSYMKYNSD
jgi:hypothetical protein